MASEPPDPVIEAYKAGIDHTLLRENLRLTPDERVRNLQRLQRLADATREAGAIAAGRPKDLEVIAELESLGEEERE